jgi:hypothetical protein
MTGKVIKVRRGTHFTIELGNLHEAWVRDEHTIEREPDAPEQELDLKKPLPRSNINDPDACSETNGPK